MSSPKQELREALGALEDAIAQADWPLVRLCFTRARARARVEALYAELVGAPLLAERYWCGCVRESRWVPRCERHVNLDHDEEPRSRGEEAPDAR